MATKHAASRQDAQDQAQRLKDRVENPPESSGPVTIDLAEEFTYNGAHYGPGTVDAPDQETADALMEAQERLNNSRTRTPVVTVHGIVSGIDPNTVPRGVLKPDQMEEHVDYANRNAPRPEEGEEGADEEVAPPAAARATRRRGVPPEQPVKPNPEETGE
jgi:hypothetical protein